jgi:hypothetical protein
MSRQGEEPGVCKLEKPLPIVHFGIKKRCSLAQNKGFRRIDSCANKFCDWNALKSRLLDFVKSDDVERFEKGPACGR